MDRPAGGLGDAEGQKVTQNGRDAGKGRPLAIDLFCGLGGWTEGLLAEGYDVIGFDIERHVYGEEKYPAQLVIQDVRTLHGSQFRDAALIVASPPCQEFSYMAMPWSRAKAKRAALLNDPEGRKRLTELFDVCFRIQREACEAAGRRIPMVVENVRGANEWVGRSRWNFGSFHLWGDVPALMPIDAAIKNRGGSWFKIAHNTGSGHGRNPDGRNGGCWMCDPIAAASGVARFAAQAKIARIPLPLARHIARVYRPDSNSSAPSALCRGEGHAPARRAPAAMGS
jgi:hypothetical protein